MSGKDDELIDVVQEEKCANCATLLAAGVNYCPSCGQDVKNKVVPIKELAGDVVRDTLGFESKFFNSIPKLLFRPGYLTNEFVKGKRATYIPAIRMYIFISIVAFLIFSIDSGKKLPDDLITDPTSLEAIVDTLSTDTTSEFDLILSLDGVQVDNMAAFKKKMDEVGFEVWLQEEMPDEPIMQFFMRKLFMMYENNGWQQVNQNIERNLSVMMFFLIPFFALLMKLLLWRSYYVVHLIFCFHLVSFFFIEMSIFELLDIYVLQDISVVGLLLFIVYFYIALAKVYKKRWFINLSLTLLNLVLFVASTAIFIICTSLIAIALY